MSKYEYDTYEVENVSQLLKAVDDIGLKFKCNSDEMWYRGVSNENHKLIPGFYRNTFDPSMEETVIHDFVNSYSIYSNNKCNHDLELYSLMQHYGLPTRLLDWSCSPLIACYFALEKLERSADEGHRTIWVISPAELNRLSIGEYKMKIYNPNISDIPKIQSQFKSILAIRPPFNNRRITAQKGQFTLHYTDKPIEEYFEEADSREIAKIKITKDEIIASFMKKQLHVLGYKEDDIYQDLDSLSKRIIRERKNVSQQIHDIIPKELLNKAKFVSSDKE